MGENILIDFFERTARKLSSMEEGYEIQKVVEKELNKDNVFGFWAPVEGVGKTTVVVNVAYELAKRGNTVCIVDLNLLMPDVFRYLKPDMEINKNEQVKSIKEKLVNTNMPVTEFIMKTKYNNIAMLTPLFTEHPSIYCPADASDTQIKREVDVYTGIFRDLGNLYDYVLLDLDPNIVNVSTVAAFKSCDNIITFIGHYPKAIEQTIKTIKIFNELGLMGTFDNMVQGPIFTETWTEEEIKLFNPNSRIIANIPYSNEVNAAGNNLEIFIAYSKGIGRTASEFRDCIFKIAATLEVLLQRSTESNKLKREEAAESTEIILEGMAEYMEQMDDVTPYVEILSEDAFISGIIDADDIIEIEEPELVLEPDEIILLSPDEIYEEPEEWEVVK